MRAQERATKEGLGVLREVDHEGSSICDFEGGRAGSRSRMGSRGKSNVAGTTYGYRVTMQPLVWVLIMSLPMLWG